MQDKSIPNLDEMVNRLFNAMPGGILDLKHDAEKNLRAGLRTALAKMDLVTREEFDVQTAVLARTRAKLESLEKQVKELEHQLKVTSDE